MLPFIQQYKGMNYCYGSNIENLRIFTMKGKSQKQKEYMAQIASEICKLDQSDKVYQKSPGNRIGMKKWGHHGRDGCFAKMAQKTPCMCFIIVMVNVYTKILL